MVTFSETERGYVPMNTLEVLTLVLVIFAVLTYLDNHRKKQKNGYLLRQIGDSLLFCSFVINHHVSVE